MTAGAVSADGATAGAASEGESFPAGRVIEPASDLRTKSGGRILIGGAPLTITRLSDGGAKLVGAWFAGTPVSDRPAHRALARRLTRSGMAHLTPASAHGGETATIAAVIIPVKDDGDGLGATLDHLDRPAGAIELAPTDAAVIVIDDGSTSPIDIDRPGVTVARNEHPTGPGAARQRGLSSLPPSGSAAGAGAGVEVVAFVDAGVLVTPQDLRRLLIEFDDPAVVAVAPRVASSPADHRVGRFDRLRSPLDLGPSPSLVGPGRTVPYVPTACLLVRRDTLERVGGFDPGLRYGEDVDLVWRLGEAGSVRYQPAVTVYHPPRSTVATMAAQRRSYGSAAAPLAVKHGAAVAPARVSPWSLLVFSLAVAGRPLLTAATVLGNALALRPKIEPLPDLTVEAVLLTTRGHWYGSLSLLTAVVRTWAPILVVAALVVPSQRRRLLGMLAAGFSRRLLDGPRRPADAAIDLGYGIIDDVAYCAGVWQGVMSTGSTKALHLDLTSWPKPKPKPDQS